MLADIGMVGFKVKGRMNKQLARKNNPACLLLS